MVKEYAGLQQIDYFTEYFNMKNYLKKLYYYLVNKLIIEKFVYTI
jgi:hypothetical protein